MSGHYILRKRAKPTKCPLQSQILPCLQDKSICAHQNLHKAQMGDLNKALRHTLKWLVDDINLDVDTEATHFRTQTSNKIKFDSPCPVKATKMNFHLESVRG